MFKILIIDSDQSNLKLLSEKLSGIGFLVFTSNSFEQGYEILVKEIPNLIISDITPPADSHYIPKKINEYRKSNFIDIIYMSTFYQEQLKNEDINSGSATLFRKPLDINNLCQTVRSIYKKKKTTILLCDDDELIVKLLEDNLKKHGYSVIACFNGSEALKALNDNKPNLAILDINMPGLNGRTLGIKIRENKRICDIPIVYLSANNDHDGIVELAKIGIDGYIIKPFDIDEVIQRLIKLLK